MAEDDDGYDKYLEEEQIARFEAEYHVMSAFENILKERLEGVPHNDKALLESNIFTASVIRSLTAMVVMFTASIFFSKKINFAKDIKIFKLFLVTVILLFSSNIIWFVSLDYTTGSITTILGSSAPIFGIILGYIFLKEKIGKIELLSLVVALSGIAIMISI